MYFKDMLIKDLKDFHVSADITIEELADNIMDSIKHMTGRSYAIIFGECPVCEDCPDECPITTKGDKNDKRRKT